MAQSAPAAAPRLGIGEAVQCTNPAVTAAGRSGGRSWVTLIRDGSGGFGVVEDPRLVNNLSWAVGFMELANACDFAANVWNQTPVPVYAVVFMAIGGTFAGLLSVLAFLDARLAYRNVRFLRRHWRHQKAVRARTLLHGGPVRDMDVYLDVTFRELGSEIMARWIMDLLMGFGAALISIGTYMAIAGANRDVWRASNILSGYLGNAPIAVYGLFNGYWACYIGFKAQGHVVATRRVLADTKAGALIRRRSRSVQIFCAINGTATLLGGAGSLITATRWWGYFILIPVIVSSIFCNVWWRRRVGYTRLARADSDPPSLVPSELIDELEFAARAAATIREHQEAPMDHFVADPTSMSSVVVFLQEQGLLDVFCLKAVAAPDICDALGGRDSTELRIGTDQLLALPQSFHPRLLKMAQKCLRIFGPEHFRNRERYTAELLGSFYRLSGSVDFDGNDDEKDVESCHARGAGDA